MNMADTLQLATPSEREIVMTRRFKARRELVWRTLVEPELVRQWLLGPPGWTMPECEIDLRVGGRYRFVWEKDDGKRMVLGGVHTAIVEAERIARTELFGPDWTSGETLVTLELFEFDGGTTVTTTVVYPTAQAREGALFSGMKEGVEMGYQRLDRLLAQLS